jgi:serine/threonine protein kinase
MANHGHIIVEAVQYMHTKGFVHIDIKSDNIFVGAIKSCVLGDFGSAKRIGEPITTSNLVDFAPLQLVSADWYMLLLTLFNHRPCNE